MSTTFNTHDGQRVGRRANVFQPPRTPSASSSVHLAQPANSIMMEKHKPLIVTKKRSRHDSTASNKATPISQTMDWSNGYPTGDSIVMSGSLDPGSPLPFVNTRYQIAGGLDTPTAAAANYFEESEFSDTGYRRNLPSDASGKPHFETEYHSFARLPSSASMETNGQSRVPSLQQNTSGGWSKAALNVVGGVVGRVWQFCKAGAFSGFSAGGGQQYQLDPYHTIETEIDNQNDSEFWESGISRKATLFNDTSGRSSTPVPGQYPDESICIVDPMDRGTPEGTPARATKRRQIDVGSSDAGLGKNWVVVPSTPATATPKPAGRYSMPTSSSASRRQPNGAPSTASRPSARPGHRRPLLHTRTSGVSHAGSPGLRSSGPASYASPRSPGGSKIPVPISSTASQSAVAASPAAIQAQKWAAKKRKEDLEADKSMSKLNAQLQAMIREGKEALGTTFEVKDVDEVGNGDTDMDEGFEEPVSTPSRGRWR
ncbi:hypothetical protein V490_08582 [Pseudogymnoascus sp. VKM F-3557]|nr:hypothetical protein V490_08582 [Pseudogymnoascus sp. VKM F-3557]